MVEATAFFLSFKSPWSSRYFCKLKFLATWQTFALRANLSNLYPRQSCRPSALLENPHDATWMSPALTYTRILQSTPFQKSQSDPPDASASDFPQPQQFPTPPCRYTPELHHILRVGPPLLIHQDCQKVTYDAQMESRRGAAASQRGRAGTIEDTVRASILASTRVVCSTLSGSGMEAVADKMLPFDIVIIDETAQVCRSVFSATLFLVSIPSFHRLPFLLRQLAMRTPKPSKFRYWVLSSGSLPSRSFCKSNSMGCNDFLSW